MGCVFLSSVAKHSTSSCLKFSHGSGSRFIASLLHPLTRWVSPMRKVSRSFLPDCLLRLGLMWFVCDFFWFLFAVIVLCAWVGWSRILLSLVNVFGVWGFVLCVWIRDVLFMSDAKLLSKSGI